MAVEVDFPNKASQNNNPIDAVEFGKHLSNMFSKHVFNVSQDFLAEFQGNNLTCRVSELEVTKGSQAPTSEDIKALQEGDVSPSPLGILSSAAMVSVGRQKESPVNLVNVQKSTTSSKMFRPDFSFSKMGIGGLDLQIADIFRRAFASRVYPASVLAQMGLMHVRGVLLYGAPGYALAPLPNRAPTHARMHTNAHTHTHTHTHTQIHTYKHTYKHTYSYSQFVTLTHMHTLKL
jgi:vesicle-fusing ATPase